MADLKAFADQLVNLTVKEVNELATILKDEYGIEPAAAAAVVAAVKKGNGKAVVTTVSGGKLTVTLDNDKVKLTDESGNSAYVVAADLKGSNGVVHVIDSVVLPK